jgi:hypothetical protein
MNYRKQHSNSDLRPPKKRKPFRVEGKVSHRVRLYGPERTKLRESVYLRAAGFCERKLPGCGGYTPWKSGHLSHVRSVGSGGADTEENTLWSCASCHSKSHNCEGKPCPPKPKAEETA